jgi:hypothetical protein
VMARRPHQGKYIFAPKRQADGLDGGPGGLPGVNFDAWQRRGIAVKIGGGVMQAGEMGSRMCAQNGGVGDLAAAAVFREGGIEPGGMSRPQMERRLQDARRRLDMAGRAILSTGGSVQDAHGQGGGRAEIRGKVAQKSPIYSEPGHKLAGRRPGRQ